MRKYILILFIFLTTIVSAQVTVQLQAPNQAEVGDKIRISYVVNTNDVEDFQVKDFPGFRVLYGPSTSSQSSFSMVNGKTTRNSSITFTYTVQPTEEGVLEIPTGTVVVKGKTYTSKSGQIEILPASSSSSSNSSGHNGMHDDAENEEPQGRSNLSIGDKELYMDVSASKTTVYEQEAVLLTYKLYTLVNIQQLSGEMPELDGFHVQEIDSKAQMSLKYERVNGRNYGTAIWRQYVLFPQKSGKMTVPSIDFEAQIEVHNTSMDPFDIFFGGGSLSQLVKKKIKTPAVELDVKQLPSPRPDNFNGAVGSYQVSGSLTPQELKANDAATLRLVISGYGNMKLMKAPVVKFPKDFEVYDPKKEDKTVHTHQGAKGNVLYDYIVVPRHGGKYNIPPVEFCYFDIDKNSYQTLRTDSFRLSVEKSANESHVSAQSQEDLKVLGSDIHFIKLGKVNVDNNDNSFIVSAKYKLIYIVLSVLFIILSAIFKRYIKTNANYTRNRIKKAGKAANKRLRTAEKLMHERKVEAFYDEVMRALLGYAGDKLNMHTVDLTKDNVRQALAQKQVDNAIIDAYLDIVAQCEYARFAPGDPNATMDRIFTEATEAINKLDTILK